MKNLNQNTEDNEKQEPKENDQEKKPLPSEDSEIDNPLEFAEPPQDIRKKEK